MNYRLRLDIFEGPLDLLLYLIKKNDINIKDIPIAEITEQYLEYIEMMKLLDLEIVGDFLVMAATLMHIKSKMLLPPDPSEVESEEDPRDELVNRLTEYQRFKQIADELQMREKERKDLLSRPSDEASVKRWKEEAKEIYYDVSLFDLINALSEALQRVPEEVIHEIIKEEFTIEQKIHEILHGLLEKQSLMLKALFGKSRSKSEAIVTFLAVLELIRLKEIKVVQQHVFGDIEILRNKDNIVPIETQGNVSPENVLEESANVSQVEVSQESVIQDSASDVLSQENLSQGSVSQEMSQENESSEKSVE